MFLFAIFSYTCLVSISDANPICWRHWSCISFLSFSLVCSASVCPLVFPDMRHVARGCGDGISNQTACCSAMESYVSHLQKQSFITNLQALDCATSLGIKLRKSNITENVYSLCHVSLKDFSLQGWCYFLIPFSWANYICSLSHWL